MGLMGIREGGCEKSKQINTEILYAFFWVIPRRLNSGAGELPSRKHTTFRTQRKFEIKNNEIVCCLSIILSDNWHDCIATRYGLDGPGIESRLGGEIFRTHPDRPWGPPSLLYNGYQVFPGCKAVGA